MVGLYLSLTDRGEELLSELSRLEVGKEEIELSEFSA